MPNRWAITNGNWGNVATWNDGAILGIPTGSDDVFSNTFTVNINQSFQALTLNNTARTRDTVTPTMTSNTTPSPYVAAANNERATNFNAWNVFDKNASTDWLTADGVTTGFVSIDLGSGNATVVDSYTITGRGDQTTNPRNWTLEGSNNGLSWTVLHTVTLASALTAGQVYPVASIGNTAPYRWYRINISLNGGNVIVGFRELDLWQSGSAALAAGGSFNFNSGSISGSVTSATPLSAGATNLIAVTANTGSVTLTLGGTVSIGITSANLINITGNCNVLLSGGYEFQVGAGSISSNCINKTGAGNLIISGTLRPGNTNSGTTNALNVTAGTVTINGNVIGGNGTAGNRGISATTNAVITVNGNVNGGPGSGATANPGISATGATVIVNGSIIGGLNSAAISTDSALLVTGNVTGGGSGASATGILTSGFTVINGNISASTSNAVSSTSANTINVSGSVISSATANAISATNASAVVNLSGNMVNTAGKTAIYCQNLFLSNTATTQAQFFTIGSQDRTLYSADTFPNLPSASNVRFGTTYGPGSGNTGTLRMALPQDVRSGVRTDNTTGSAILSAQSLFNEISSSTDPFAQRLRNVSTVDTVGYLLTAFKK